MEWWVSVQGSQPQPYVVTVRKVLGGLLIDCSCPAGEMGQICKHRVGLIEGTAVDVVESSHEAGTIKALFGDTTVARKLLDLRAAEGEAEKLKKRISGMKKEIARLMSG